MNPVRLIAGVGLLLSAALWSEAGAAGSIRGTVSVTGPMPAQKKVEVTIDQYVCGSEKDAGDLIVSSKKELKNAVVWLDNPPPGAAPDSQAKVAMDQNGCVFLPRVVVVPAGGTVDFLNSDRLLHNIHATPKLNVSFNRTQPKDRTIPVVFAKPEIVRINCDLHSWMIGWVVVAAHPYYAITGPDGQFAFDKLPPGNYTLHVWHERLGTTQASVTVRDQAPARIAIEMKAR
ncbi:MAG TPA: carboxypeptidase regulatory-like domain-containing protein [Casimicrobiaceae bacterium]|nr:carboxypeptidase regulatory-like domain-containing protein [Casimicrobiaceae bacterium]